MGKERTYMSKQKRTDKKGRVLRTGELQRKKDGIYEYRYTGLDGKRRSIYASDLNELRRKETEINKAKDSFVEYSKGDMTVYEMVSLAMETNKNAHRRSTNVQNKEILKRISKYPESRMHIRDVRTLHLKTMISRMAEDYAYNTVLQTWRLLKSSFRTIYEEGDILVRDPSAFFLKTVIKNTSKKVKALTPDQQRELLQFVSESEYFVRCYDWIVVLLETGLRIGELIGLTLDDVDFVNKKISINKQIQGRNKNLYIEQTKTESGNREIPLSKAAYMALKRIVGIRPYITKVVPMIDGYSKFLFTTNRGHVRQAQSFQRDLRNIVITHNQSYPQRLLPKITPHTLRHTFCTNLVKAGINPKSLQYLMGHSDITTTLNVYADSDFESAQESMGKVVNLDY